MSYQGQPPVQPAQFDEKDGSSLEKGGVNDYVVHHNDTGSRQYQFDAADLDRVQRRLKERHVQMIAVCHFRYLPRFPTNQHMLPAARSLVLLVLVYSWDLAMLCKVLVL